MEEIARGMLNKNKEGKTGWLRKNSLTAFKEVEVPFPDSLDPVLTKDVLIDPSIIPGSLCLTHIDPGRRRILESIRY